MKYYYHIVAMTIIVGISSILLWQNHVPGTSLMGWDDLHPEYNFQTAIMRSINGVWRSDQGLGSVAAHSHMAELPRVIFLWLLSILIPTTYLRFVFVSICLYSGAMGMYILCYQEFKRITTHKTNPMQLSIGAFFSSLIYVFNLGTIQQFILPFEMFTVQFALMPWILLSASKLLESISKTKLLIFTIVTLLFSATAYAATLWYFFLIIFFFWLLLSIRKTNMKKVVLIFLLFICLNLFWILPNIYFVKNHGTEVKNSKQNRLFSQEIFEKNKEFGTLQDAFLLKGFLFDWSIYNFEKKSHEQIMSTWQKHLENPLVLGIGYGMSLMSLIGIVLVFKKHNKHLLPYIIFSIFPVLFLLNGTSPFSNAVTLLTSFSPTITEALRNPFTKVSIPAGFGIALFAGFALSNLSTLHKKLNIFVYVVLFSSILLFGLPTFRGEFMHRNIQTQMPKEYIQMFEYFRSQPETSRVALFPVNSFWNWTSYTWGYQGAGFLQFGIRQPILDRDYDRWSLANEQYFREMSHAVYSQNPTLLKNVILKYDIDFIVFDTSVFDPSLNHEHSLGKWFIPRLIEETNLFAGQKQFGKDIFVYKKRGNPTQKMYVLADISNVEAGDTVSSIDTIYHQTGNYSSKFPQATSLQDSVARYDQESPRKYVVELGSYGDWESCDGTGTFSRSIANGQVRYVTEDASICETLKFEMASHEYSYILRISSANISGRPLTVCMKNILTEHCDLFEQLNSIQTQSYHQYFIPNLKDFGVGYQLELTQYGKMKGITENHVKSIELIQVNSPTIYDQSDQTSKQQISASTTYYTPTFFQVEIDPSIVAQKNTLVLSERFDTGWKAYYMCSANRVTCNVQKWFPFIFGTELKKHVLINNWANGWKLDREACPPADEAGNPKRETCNIVIIFWPQYLEYLGFGFLIVTIILFTIPLMRDKFTKYRQSI